MIDLLQNTADGLMVGSSYGLLALGFTLIFGVLRRLNLSYGPSIMIGAYLGTSAAA
jgi:branched-subunit amino acid ABC-type transport system permease component